MAQKNVHGLHDIGKLITLNYIHRELPCDGVWILSGFEMALLAILKCLDLLHDHLGTNSKKLWLHIHNKHHTHVSLVII